ncbi:hypothetical protein ACQP1S_12590 [Micromonospora matsumotoense]|uniref:hypothetical protein n=1 Tax=Micromonospora matsumotoense TaxID=121616 RepID=UPI003D8F73C3
MSTATAGGCAGGTRLPAHCCARRHRCNADQTDLFRGLVRPTDAESTWNGYRVGQGRRLDWERQADAACAAFARNGFVLLVGDRQVEDLDEEIDLLAEPEVAFVRLVALVGG